MKLNNKIYYAITLVFFLSCHFMSPFVEANEKVAVLITSWGAPAGFNFDYAWNNHRDCRIGDLTEYEGQPCKIGHVGEFPYQSHLGILPWGLHHPVEGFEISIYDNSGTYKLVDGVYVGMHPDIP